MSEVTIIRHAEADYPNDRLTVKGQAEATSIGKKLFDSSVEAISSPKLRAVQTIKALGFKNFRVDRRLAEFEIDVKVPTAEEYINLVHSERWQELITFGDELLVAIKEYGTKTDSLIVAHNAIMSAAFRILTGEIFPFENLGGFKVEVVNNEIGKPSKVMYNDVK